MLATGGEPDEPLLDVGETPSAGALLAPDLNRAARSASSSSSSSSPFSRGCVSTAVSASPSPAVGECVLALRDGRTLAVARRPDAGVALVRLAELGARALRSAHAPAYHLYQLLRAHSGAPPRCSVLADLIASCSYSYSYSYVQIWLHAWRRTSAACCWRAALATVISRSGEGPRLPAPRRYTYFHLRVCIL